MAVLSRPTAAWALAVLACGAVGTLGTCYSPELRDCVVSCAGQDDCAPGHVCGTDRMCASPQTAGSCRATIVDGGGLPDSLVVMDARPDGPAIDAFVPPDAPQVFQLIVRIHGRGRVLVSDAGECDHTAPDHGCTFAVEPGIERTLTAIPDDDHEFDKWTSLACAGRGPMCTLTPTLLTTMVTAKFEDD